MHPAVPTRRSRSSATRARTSIASSASSVGGGAAGFGGCGGGSSSRQRPIPPSERSGVRLTPFDAPGSSARGAGAHSPAKWRSAPMAHHGRCDGGSAAGAGSSARGAASGLGLSPVGGGRREGRELVVGGLGRAELQLKIAE